MSGVSLDVLRTGKKYRLVNHGERHEFVIENILPNGDFKKDLIKYGKGSDYLLEEITDMSA